MGSESENVGLIRSGDTILEYSYNKKATIGELRKRGKPVYGNHEVKCKVRIYLPDSHPKLFSRYKGIVHELLNKSKERGKKLTKITFIDPKTGTKWEIVKKTSFWMTIAKILSFFDIFHMIHFNKSPGISEYELKQKRNLVEILLNKSFGKIEKKEDFVLPHQTFSLNESTVQQRVNYNDPFTKIAALAYQNYEHDFVGHDEGGNAAHINSDWVVATENNSLRLIPKSQKSEYKDASRDALIRCRDHFFNLYGEEKVKQGLHLAQFDFDAMIESYETENFIPLTPEHIYRMNIMMTSVESQEVESFIKKIEHLRDSTFGETFLDVVYQEGENNFGLSERELDVLVRYVRLKHHLEDDVEPTVEQFLQATAGLMTAEKYDSGFLDHIPSKELTTLIEMMMPSEESREASYTGRKIQRPVEGPYTSADDKYYKPWVDQQELLQANEELEKNTVKDLYTAEVRSLRQDEKQRRFDELSAFVIVRKHLFKSQPNGKYSVGEIIPAPSSEDGEKRWYRLNRIVASHEGLLHYYFEPVGSGSGLQTCMMAKSTSSVPYAFESEGTVKNDLNPLNPPGYEGRRHVKEELEVTRKEHTIPVWVAYQHAASLCLNKENVTETDKLLAQSYLERASVELKKEEIYHHRKKSLHEIVREYDSELNDCSWSTASLGDVITSLPVLSIFAGEKRKFDKLLASYAHDVSIQDILHETPEDSIKRQEEEKVDAKALMQYFYEHAAKTESGELQLKYREFIDAIGDHIYHDENGNLSDADAEMLRKVGYAGTGRKMRDESVVKSFDPGSEVEERLVIWERGLREYAKSICEDVASKKTNGIRLIGHSLGGALSEIEAFEMTAGTYRLPVPGTTINVRMYDDPGMSHEDNVSQHIFMLAHKQVLKSTDAKVDVYYSHDYGDVAPACGTAHLSAMTPHVMEEIRRSLKQLVEESTCEKVKVLNEKGSLDTEDGQKALLELFLHDVDDVYPSVTEIKKATHYALESETADYLFKHGTRYEMTRREKSEIIRVAKHVGKGKLDVDILKDVRLLGNYVNRLFPEGEKGQELEVFKISKASEQKVSDEYSEYLEFKEKQEAGKQFSHQESVEFKKLGFRYDHLYSISKLMEAQTKLKGVLYPEVKKIIAYRELGKVSVKQLENYMQTHDISLEDLEKTTNTLIHDFKKDLEAIEQLYAEARKVEGYDKKKILREAKKQRKVFVKKYRNILNIVKNHYTNEVHAEAKKSHKRALGGVQISYISKEGLGTLSGSDNSVNRFFVSKVWGLGVFLPERTEYFRRHAGRHFAPYHMKEQYLEANRDEEMKRKGHGLALTQRDPYYKTLVVSAN